MGELELCRRRKANSGRITLHKSQIATHSPVRLALSFFYELAGELEEDPIVFPNREDLELAVLFRRSCCRCDDLLVGYANQLAQLSAHWPVTLCGTIDGTEVGEVSLHPEETALCWTQSNVSGLPFEKLSDLCVKLRVDTYQNFDLLALVMERLSFRGRCVALPKHYEGYCTENGLGKPIQGTRFCYLPMLDEADPDSALEALNMDQRTALWAEFLGNGLSFQEFEWAWDACREGRANGLLEWELALRFELVRQGVKVTNTVDCFQVTDREGAVLRFDALSHNAAERLFLKILFPVSPAQ